ncbi:MAG TPA: alkaline phosphatase [Microbacterium sp.]|uniref:chitosanase n=1 Tax=Microbacterium sp. TaxID=51671 RepID=UPI000EF05455|nr:alkaline phosphatase [Microbacterium sp.]
MRHRRPLLGLLAAAVTIPLVGGTLIAATAQADTPSLRDPIKREMAQEIVTSAENSRLDWYNMYGYIEDIDDGRGYTGGIIGFTSGTSDMLELVERYTADYPDNGLAEYLPALRAVDGTESHEGLGDAYVAAWEAEGDVAEFQRAQRDLTRDWYFEGSVDLGLDDGLGALGQFIYYDAAVVHGFSGMEEIRSTAMGDEGTPAEGGSETAYLNAFLDARVIEMQTEAAHEDVTRIENAQRPWLEAGNLDLDTPLTWSVYGDPFEIPTDPEPHWPANEIGDGTGEVDPGTDPVPSTTISKDRPATASSVEDSTMPAASAVDGDEATRWASEEGVDPQWIQVDLGAGANIDRVILKWEAAYATDYRIETSDDGSNWAVLAEESAGNGGTDEHANLEGTARYLRVSGTARGTDYGYSLYELEVYGTPGEGGDPDPDPDPDPEPGAGAFTVVGAGDIAGEFCSTRGEKTENSDCEHFETADRAQEIDPAFYITFGDMQYDDGHLSDFTSVYDKSWGKFKDNTWPVPGNHEAYDTDWDDERELGDEAAYREYFGDRATPEGKMWYSYDYGNWHFIALNSNRLDEQEQVDWLDNDLAANDKQCTMAYYHHPVVSSGEHGSVPYMKPIWKKLADADVEIVLNGHDHHYERFAPMDGDLQPSSTGTVEIISGLGGHEMRDIPNVRPNSVKRINTAYGVSQLDFTDTTVVQKFVAIDGTVLDATSTITCH